MTTSAPSTHGPSVEQLAVSAYTIPTDEPESDGTLEWDSTTIVVVEIEAAGERGLGYTYGPHAVGALVSDLLADVVRDRDAFDVRGTWRALQQALRNAGRPGIGSMAFAAVDVALWDLKARLLGLPLVRLLDAAHEGVPVYGSGGFTSYSNERLGEQLGGWVEAGIPRVKMKVGRDPDADPARLDAARRAIGDDQELFVDANGAYGRKEGLAWAERYRREWGVTWLEEPVSSDDLDGLRLLRDRGPGGLDIAAGEYVYILRDAVALLEAGAVDCLQLDVTRCGGITGFLQAAGAAAAHQLDVSGHCAPALSAHALCAVSNLRHLEYFHDHVRVEELLFDGTLSPEGGVLTPDGGRPGHGLELKRAEAERYAA
ncbi:MAG TPA: enolase C-terminal domain-like protein [Gaiellaceae bacterium]|nr:enolase C-terminal domain-like protein [Gaiellaceae bacterium]